ncbi:MAG: amidohydrolase family protein [Nitrospiraceae bacterium]|nr:amidohydrolase family protein [Nitrospiraceae bacterium]
METRIRGTLLGDTKPSDVIVRGGVVAAVTPAGRGRVDAGSRDTIIGPTLFDIQVNGVRGIDLQTDHVTPEDVRAITGMLAGTGVSQWVPTLVTGGAKTMEQACRVIAEALQDRTVARAVPGVHVEGPYISPMDGPRGAHPLKHVRPPSVREFDRLNKAADGKILYVTLAPEQKGAVAFIKAMVRRGVTVSLGHHNADARTIETAIDAGARLSTHLGNGLASMIHRHENPLWPQLADDRLTAAFIADLQHLPSAVLKSFVRAKGAERVVLTSDCVHIAGLKPGAYEMAGQPVELLPTGRICLSGTDLLAGSSLMLLQGVVNAARVTDLTLEQAFASASTIPAKLFGVRRRFALPRAGTKADFVAFDVVEDTARVRAVFVNGQLQAGS